jgi:hypothetical protein
MCFKLYGKVTAMWDFQCPSINILSCLHCDAKPSNRFNFFIQMICYLQNTEGNLVLKDRFFIL